MRSLLLLLAFAAAAAISFFVIPGHSYALNETQALVPMLEHLRSPGLLSRDLVATHPNLTYTIYDETTLFLQGAARIPISLALAVQHAIFRFASVAGLYLLARAARASTLTALSLTVAFHLGVCLAGSGLALVDPEPTPTSFAIGAVLLAAGLFATGRPLTAALFGGIAVVYDARVAAPLWLLLFVAALLDRRMRPFARATLPVIAVFALLLANVAQLQPSIPEAHGLLELTPAAIGSVQQFRTPHIFVGLWTAQALLWFVALAACCYWTVRQVWPDLALPARWLFAGLPLAGVLSVPLSYLLIDRVGWALGPQIQPARTLLFTAVFTFVAAGAIFARNPRRVQDSLPAVAIAGLLLVSGHSRPGAAPPPAATVSPDAAELARWAEDNTWGGSMFLFPDAGRDRAPGLFRVRSRRAVWVDWQTGSQSDYFDSFADEWYRRWQDTMSGTYSEHRLAGFLALPIDYYVLRREHALPAVRPVFTGRHLLVYDAADLRRTLL